jgi:hypothetical protein
MRLCFDSIDEVKAFVAQLKGTRGSGKKGDSDDGDAGTPGAQPAATGQQATGFSGASGFAPPAPSANPASGFPAAAAAQTVHPLAKSIIERAEASLKGGSPVDSIVGWFKTQFGPDAANVSTWEGMKPFVERASETHLKQMAPQLGITA